LTHSLIDPADPPELTTAKLLKMTEALMARVERATNDSGEAYAHFQRAILLEDQVRERTRDLELTLDLLNRSNAQLSQAKHVAERARADLYNALEAVREGFALFNADDVLVMCNDRFGAALPDIAPRLHPGLGFVAYAKLCARSRHLVLPEGTTRSAWLRQRLRDHRKQSVNFNVAIDGGRWIQVSAQRTPGNGTAIMQTDITSLIQMERSERDKLLDEQARLIRATLDHIDQGICIFDAWARLVGWNSRLRGLLSPPIQILRVGTSFATLVEHFRHALVFQDTTGPNRLVEWVGQGENRPPLMLDLRTRDGLFLQVFGQEMPDRGFVISFSDVTAERSAAAALQAAKESLEQRVAERTLALEDALEVAERANASKSRFVAAASHDLLQPLSAAKLFLAAAENADGVGGQIATIRQVRSALESVESILGALLDISRLDSGNASFNLTTFPLERLLERLGQEFREIARHKGLDLRMVPTTVIVRSDASYLRRIVQNLLANAVRYTRRGKVLVGARRIPGAVRIEVWDTGPGIPEDARETIFREFQRLDAADRAHEGMGLGLAIVERACALLGHPLELVSVPGRGTGFSVEVPRVDTMGPLPQARARILATEQARPTGLIALVIENDEAVRLGMSTLLEAWGVGVLDVSHGDEALALLEDIGIAPDVILADLHLQAPTNGIHAVAAIRKRHGPIPAFLVTADHSAELAACCEVSGIPILRKPVEPARLRALLAGIAPGATAVD
jgi:signal transduction histidine kinase/CheY-like chemotaxis protein